MYKLATVHSLLFLQRAAHLVSYLSGHLRAERAVVQGSALSRICRASWCLDCQVSRGRPSCCGGGPPDQATP